MCRSKLASVSPCSCDSAKLTKMDKTVKKCSSSPALTVPSQPGTTAQGSLKKAKKGHLWTIRNCISKARTKPRKSTKESKSNKYPVLSSGSDHSNADVIPELEKDTLPSHAPSYTSSASESHHSLTHACSGAHDNPTETTTEPLATAGVHVHKRSPSRRNLRVLIPTPATDEQLQIEEEFKVRSDGAEKEIVTERLEDSDLDLPDFPSPTPLSALELIGLDYEDLCSDSDSVIDPDSIQLHIEDDDSDDVGPGAIALQDENSDLQSHRRVTFRNKVTLYPRCHSSSEVHRRIHVLDDLLYSIDLEDGASDLGPEPEVVFDNFLKRPMSEAECTKQQVTSGEKQSVDRVAQEEAIIDSLFASKKKHSCCKTKRKLSWNAPTRRKNSSQLHMVPRYRPRKVVVIGDMCSGKSALIAAYCKDRFSETYVPTILRSCLTDAILQGDKVELVVVEVSGRKDYLKLRKCAYRKTDAIVLCYSCDNPSSLRNIETNWLPEMREYVPNVPFILVGTRKDVRDEILDKLESSKERAPGDDDNSQQTVREKLVSEDTGYEMAKAIGAHHFLECSSRYRDNTRHVFETIAKVALQKRRRRKVQRTGDVCSIM